MNKFKHRLALFRILFPRWNFFESIGDQIRLQYQIRPHSTHLQPHVADQAQSQKSIKHLDWKLLEISTPQHEPYSFFRNPLHNLKFSIYNILEHFSQDIQNLSDQEIKTMKKNNSWLLSNTNFKLITQIIFLNESKIMQIEELQNLKKSHEIKIQLSTVSSHLKEEIFLSSDWITFND